MCSSSGQGCEGGPYYFVEVDSLWVLRLTLVRSDVVIVELYELKCQALRLNVFSSGWEDQGEGEGEDQKDVFQEAAQSDHLAEMTWFCPHNLRVLFCFLGI